MRLFASPYVAGDSLQKAMDVAARLWKQRELSSTLDLLAEDINSHETVEEIVETTRAMIDAAATDERLQDPNAKATVSLKLSSFEIPSSDQAGERDKAKAHVFELCEHAARQGVKLTIDMEGSDWTDYTLDLFDEIHARGHDHVGCVLQTRLQRTRADLDRLPAACRVRLVIGIYQEDESIAVTDKKQMKERLVEYAQVLLERGHYVEFATHDEAFIHRFLGDVVQAESIPHDRFEVQMLYGVPRPGVQRQLREQGIRCRLYVPFANGWPMAIAYLRRRLDEYPAMMFLVARNLFRRR